jgi:hypothetical protein
LNRVIFCPFYLILFQFNSLILGWLEIPLHNLFLIFFYVVIMVLWSGSRVMPVDLVFLSFLLNFFQLHPQILGWLEIILLNFFSTAILWYYLGVMILVTSLFGWLRWLFVSFFNWIYEHLVHWELNFII